MKKLSKFVSKLLPYAVIITGFILILETVKYPGFFKKYAYIDANIVVAITLTFLVISQSDNKFLQRIYKINHIFLPIIVIVYTILNAIEGLHFINYVLATYHINLEGLTLIVLYSFSLFIIDKFVRQNFKIISNFRYVFILSVFLIIVYLVKNLNFIVDQSFKRNFYIFFHPMDTYDQKMSYHWDKFYDYMIFVRNNTPEDATIVLPPMKDPWLQGGGNPHFVRAFLFPRKLIQIENGIIEDLENIDPKTYILITWGTQGCQPEGCHGWPRQDIKAKKIIYKDPDSTNVIEIREDAIYRLEDDKYVYGLVEL